MTHGILVSIWSNKNPFFGPEQKPKSCTTQAHICVNTQVLNEFAFLCIQVLWLEQVS